MPRIDIRQSIGRLWHRLFLAERPSISLSAFRIAVAWTVGFHVIPTLFHLDDNYWATAFKTYNLNFFPPEFVAFVQQSPDSLVTAFVVLFLISWFCFLVGLRSQLSCLVMTACCYYFYALNAFAIGTLSWDILLVTMVLMCVTGYHGDYFSVDAMRGGQADAYRRRRPYFVQRLLQIQIAATYFFTGLHKITREGNWLTANPMHYIFNYPPAGVTKEFFLREWLAARPEVCFAIGIMVVIFELLMPLLLFTPLTRPFAIALGFFFHGLLIATLHVPTIFFFLFPPQLLLFINPEEVIGYIEQKRRDYAHRPRYQLIFDGQCAFCRASVRALAVTDLFGRLDMMDYHSRDDIKALHPDLTGEKCHSQLHLISPDGALYGGFFVFRRLVWLCPMLLVLLPVVYFPGAGVAGPVIYRWVAKNRYLFHRAPRCQDNHCYR